MANKKSEPATATCSAALVRIKPESGRFALTHLNLGGHIMNKTRKRARNFLPETFLSDLGESLHVGAGLAH